MENQQQALTLPEEFRGLFWDCDFDDLSWQEHRDFIIRRVLASGTWKSVTWVRQQLGDAGLRSWLLQQQGRGLGRRRLRFWQLLLDLPREQVDVWLDDPTRQIWDRRVA